MTKRILKDGERLRVPLVFMDAAQRELAGHFGACVPLGEDAMPQDLKTTVVLDGLGRLAGSRPGHCYLHSDPHTTDHAVQVTREFNRQEAFNDSVAALQSAWKGNTSDHEVPRIDNTGDATRDAYLDSVSDLENAWHRGSGKR